ncbi:MAG: serine/threonine-protein kinase [Kofleriaceae bacterium]|nr:serine/threonine-protein kinase [Kofleriaceae bacterium]
MSQAALPQAEDSLIGVTLDNKYRVTRVIGRGGMGVVYEAEHAALGNRVAIKLMLEKYNNDTEAMTRFTREAHAATRIGNPHIIQVLDISHAPDGRAFVVMELLDGQPLSRLLEKTGALPPQRALSIIRQVLRAVGAAHAKGIVHRDLKPDNIFLLDQEGEEGRDFVKLLDFGISKIIDPDLQAAATKLTTTGVVMGTPLYMAPEQAMGAEIDHQADVYACGVILYEMLAGKPPFDGQTYAVLVAKLLTKEPPLLNEVRPGLAPKLVAAVHRALEKDPENRYASAEAFLAALPGTQSASAVELAHTMSSGKVPAVRRARSGGSRRGPLLPVALAMLAGIATATVGILQRQPTAAPKPPERATTAAPGSAQPTPEPTVARLTGRVAVGSQPAGATLHVDGKEMGLTPISVTLDAGKHRIQLALAGFAPVDHEIEISPDRETQFFVPLAIAKVPTNQPIVKTQPIVKKTGGVPKNPQVREAPAVRDTPPVDEPPVVRDNAPSSRELTVPPPPPPIEKKTPKGRGLTGPRANPYEPKPNPL